MTLQEIFNKLIEVGDAVKVVAATTQRIEAFHAKENEHVRGRIRELERKVDELERDRPTDPAPAPLDAE